MFKQFRFLKFIKKYIYVLLGCIYLIKNVVNKAYCK